MVHALVACGLASLSLSASASANHGLADLGSLGQINGNGPIDVQGDVGVSADGTLIVFQTSERLVSADTDNAVDVYQRASGVTSLALAGEKQFARAIGSRLTGQTG